MIFENDYNSMTISEKFKDPNTIREMVVVDEVSQLSDKKIQEFCAPGGYGETLVREGIIKESSLARISKKDNNARRKHLMSLHIAKEQCDPLWGELAKIRIIECEVLDKIEQKYGAAGEKLATKATAEYLDGGPGQEPVLPKSFQQTGGDERIDKDPE